ncbi:hypothetical protein X551_02378 [Methylibium sp. T29]|nr:hypothetical protein X551_02378 [Methylibium sp. T29]EWS61507.1 hypothetical protein Y694_00781 [Methylibium sp. T29-B]
MRPEAQIDAYRFVLEAIFDGHPNKRMALAHVDGLIAEMQVNAESSIQLQVADPLRRAVESIRADLAARAA